jgi:hypothetical protein
MSRQLSQGRIIDSYSITEKTEEELHEEAVALNNAACDPDWQQEIMASEKWCADRNWESHQAYLQEVADSKPWWQKAFGM